MEQIHGPISISKDSLNELREMLGKSGKELDNDELKQVGEKLLLLSACVLKHRFERLHIPSTKSHQSD